MQGVHEDPHQLFTAVGWGQDEGWPTGVTITIKRKAIEEPGDEGVIKGVRGKRKPWRKGPC